MLKRIFAEVNVVLVGTRSGIESGMRIGFYSDEALGRYVVREKRIDVLDD